MQNNGDLTKLHRIGRSGVTRNVRVAVVRNIKNVMEPSHLKNTIKLPVPKLGVLIGETSHYVVTVLSFRYPGFC